MSEDKQGKKSRIWALEDIGLYKLSSILLLSDEEKNKFRESDTVAEIFVKKHVDN